MVHLKAFALGFLELLREAAILLSEVAALAAFLLFIGLVAA